MLRTSETQVHSTIGKTRHQYGDKPQNEQYSSESKPETARGVSFVLTVEVNGFPLTGTLGNRMVPTLTNNLLNKTTYHPNHSQSIIHFIVNINILYVSFEGNFYSVLFAHRPIDTHFLEVVNPFAFSRG